MRLFQWRKSSDKTTEITIGVPCVKNISSASTKALKKQIELGVMPQRKLEQTSISSVASQNHHLPGRGSDNDRALGMKD